MKHLLTLGCLLFLSWGLQGQVEQDIALSTLTKINQKAPEISVKTLLGTDFILSKKTGNAVLINFFATWCGPCNAELPILDQEIWEIYKDSGLVVISIGREHSIEELKEFKKKKGFNLPMGADPKRENYKNYATKYIPRNLLIDSSGEIVYQSVGFKKDELIKKIEEIL